MVVVSMDLMIDSSNWREDYLNTKAGLSKRQIQLLTDGADSLSSSWILQAMYVDWKHIKGYTDPPPPDCSSSFLEFSKKNPEPSDIKGS